MACRKHPCRFLRIPHFDELNVFCDCLEPEQLRFFLRKPVIRTHSMTEIIVDIFALFWYNMDIFE
jgi:hypothetical protein